MFETCLRLPSDSPRCMTLEVLHEILHATTRLRSVLLQPNDSLETAHLYKSYEMNTLEIKRRLGP